METSKTKHDKSETTFISFYLKFVKMKRFFTIIALRQPSSEKRIFAVYKYSRRLLKRALSPKFFSNNLSVWLFYEWLTPSQILIFSNLKLHNWFQKVILLLLSYLPLSEFDASWICIQICVNIRYIT